MRELPGLARLGVTVLEVMPVAEFPGTFGWGYDGVNLFAPTRLYGSPADFRRFVDTAHRLGLDVVFNHFGPDSNSLAAFAPDYFTDRYENEWGKGINFDGDNAGPVREFFLTNAAFWVEEFHLDGLRLDATQSIFDASGEHILADLAQRVRAAARGKATLIVAENESQETRLVRLVEQVCSGCVARTRRSGLRAGAWSMVLFSAKMPLCFASSVEDPERTGWSWSIWAGTSTSAQTRNRFWHRRKGSITGKPSGPVRTRAITAQALRRWTPSLDGTSPVRQRSYFARQDPPTLKRGVQGEGG
jgi:hypothetical protein